MRLRQLCAGYERADSFFRHYRRRCRALLEEVKSRGLEGLIGKLRNSDLRAGPQKRRMDQAQMRERTGVRHRRIHTAARIAQTFWCNPGWLLQGQKARFCRQSGDRLHCEIIVDVAQEISEQSGERLSVCRSSLKKWAMVARNHAFDDEKMHWLNPVFVCEIKFAEWTRDKKLRAPVFLGLREDKKPSDVIREV